MENNYLLYIAVGLVSVCVATFGYLAYKYPAKVIEWLKYAVTEAERELGSGTGQIKLRKVYDLFIAKYPKLSVIIPFSIFSHWVDLALDEMKAAFETNPALKKYVVGE